MHPLLSVVCASLGRPSLVPLVSTLATCRCVGEVIIVLPPEVCPSSTLLDLCMEWDFVRLENSLCKGQVNQRVYGVRLAGNPFVMFVDDDISIDADVVDLLFARLLECPTPSVIAPSIRQYSENPDRRINLRTRGLHVIKMVDKILSPFASRLPYSLSYFHINTPFDHHSVNMLPSTWLAGGCLMMPSLIAPAESYYCFPGKAYAEDIYLSSKLLDSGASLFLAQDLVCFTPRDDSARNFNLQLFVRLAVHRLSRSATFAQVLYSLLLLAVFLLISFFVVAVKNFFPMHL
jgi:GT2 family glycosyltransferase